MKRLIIVFILLLIGGMVIAQEGQVYWLENVKIDGEFAEWKGLKPMVTKNSLYGEHKPRDAEGEFVLATDGANLFIYVDVKDDTPRVNTFHNSLAWKGDSVEIYFGTVSRYHEDYEEGDVQLRLVPRSAEDPFENDFYVSYDFFGGGTDVFGEAAVVISRRGYTIEASVPLEELSNPNISVGKMTRCEFQVNDADKIERDRLLRWSSEEDDYYTPANWGRCPVVRP